MVGDFDKLELGNDPGLVVAVVACPESDWLVVLVLSTRDIQAEALLVSDVSLTAGVEVEDLLLLTSPWSDDGRLAWLVALAEFVGDDEVLLGGRSHGAGSGVKDPPGSLVVRVRVLDSEAVLTVADLLVPEQLSVAVHLGLEEEVYSLGNWLDTGIQLLNNRSSLFLSGLLRHGLGGQVLLLKLGLQLRVDRVVDVCADNTIGPHEQAHECQYRRYLRLHSVSCQIKSRFNL